MENNAVLLMQRTNEVAHVGSEHALHWPLLRSDDMNLDLARAQRRRGLKADKAGADHDREARAVRNVNDRAAIGERAQHVDVRLIGARNGQPHRFGARRQQ